MIKKVLLLLIIFSSPLFAQKDSLSRFQIGVNITPEMNFWKTAITGLDGVVAKPGVTFGINTGYYFTDNFSLEAGLNYAFRNYQFNDSYEGFNHITLPERDEFHINRQNFELPLTINFFSKYKKIRLITSVGLVTNVLLKEKSRQQRFFSDRIEEIIGNHAVYENRISFSPMLAIGIDYRISKKVNLRIQPTGRFTIPNKNSPIRPFSTGINFGTYYRL